MFGIQSRAGKTIKVPRLIREGRSAFSLIEILIAIGIMVVLVAVAFPSLRSSMEASAKIKCNNNLRGLGVGLGSYINDHNGSLIPAYQGGYGYWFNEIAPYMESKEELNWTNNIYPSWLQCPLKHNQCGYGWNYFHFGHNTYSITNSSFARFLQVTEPTRTIIIGDSADDPNAAKSEHYVIYGTKLRLAKRHSGGSGNYLFFDGHVESMTPEQLSKQLPRIFEKYPGQKKDLLEAKNP